MVATDFFKVQSNSMMTKVGNPIIRLFEKSVEIGL